MIIDKQHLENTVTRFKQFIEKEKYKLIHFPERDKNGNVSSILAGKIRIFAVDDYSLNKIKLNLINNLKESVKTKETLLNRYDAGEPISKSYVDLLNYQELFDALATGDLEFSKQFAKKIGGRNLITETQEECHPLTFTLAPALKWCVLEDDEKLKEWLPKLKNVCEHNADSKNFKGYAEVFEAILEKNILKATLGFMHIIEGHKKESKNGFFCNMPDQYICMWGIGLANLARYRGLDIQVDDPLIPKELISN